MSAKLIIGLIIIGVLGIAMASIGIQFYNKCGKNQKLNKTNYQWLEVMLLIFCVMVLISLFSAAFLYRPKSEN